MTDILDEARKTPIEAALSDALVAATGCMLLAGDTEISRKALFERSEKAMKAIGELGTILTSTGVPALIERVAALEEALRSIAKSPPGHASIIANEVLAKGGSDAE